MTELGAGDRVYDRDSRRRGRIVVVRLLLDSVVLRDNQGNEWEATTADVEPIAEGTGQWTKRIYS